MYEMCDSNRKETDYWWIKYQGIFNNTVTMFTIMPDGFWYYYDGRMWTKTDKKKEEK